MTSNVSLSRQYVSQRAKAVFSVALISVVAATFATSCAALPWRGKQVTPTPDVPASAEGAAFVTDFENTSVLGEEYEVVERRGGAPGVAVQDGELTHADPTTDNSASYVFRNLAPDQVSRIGAKVSFSDQSSGSIALLVSSDSVPRDPNAAAPNAAVHFVATPTRWIYAIWQAGGNSQTVLARGNYVGRFDLHAAMFDIVLNGNTAKVYLPDSTSVTINDERIGEFGGSWATWELFESNPGLQPAAFKTLWAG